jgi:hypothetical protein
MTTLIQFPRKPAAADVVTGTAPTPIYTDVITSDQAARVQVRIPMEAKDATIRHLRILAAAIASAQELLRHAGAGTSQAEQETALTAARALIVAANQKINAYRPRPRRPHHRG